MRSSRALVQTLGIVGKPVAGRINLTTVGINY